MRRLARALSRLPIRVRLTLAFTGVIALALLVAGGFLARELRRDLDGSIDEAQRVEAQDVAALVAGPGGPSKLSQSGERFAQVFGAGGELLASTAAAGPRRLLDRAALERAARRPVTEERRAVDGTDVRVRAMPLRLADAERAVVAVGYALRERDASLASLERLLLIALPAALLVAAFAGYEVSGAALRPVDRMRRRAAAISESTPSERLPVPEARDEISALGSTLNEMLDRLEAGLERERRLVSDASHELRTPLTTLRAELQLALRGERDVGELRTAISSAHEETRRLSTLADDLLVLARADQGHLPLQPEPWAAEDLLAAAARRAQAAIAQAGRSIHAPDSSSDVRVVLADPDRVAQVLDNLIANSLVHGNGPIELAVGQAGRLVELHVMDRGGGFEEAFLAHAFERFTRAARGGPAQQGAGLGLAIAEAIGRAHGGGAGARNRPGGGADVWLALPEA